jgi:Asp-tRNA(Asn)/Glu-tRNA(Gln) amidotransferase A subunit family amidase
LLPKLREPGAVAADQSEPAERGISTGEISSRELVDAAYARIEQRDDGVSAWVRLYPESAHAASAAADQRLAAARRDGSRVPLLTGVPIGLKDIIAVKDMPIRSTAGLSDGVVPECFPAAVRAGQRTISRCGG